MIRGLATSPDGLWAVARAGREAWLLAGGAGPPAGHLVLDADDAELAFVGPPSALLAVSRAPGATRVALYQPPLAEPVARLELDLAARLGAITGPRLALIADDRQHVVLVRAAGAALAHHTIDAGAPIELVVGLERNQLLLAVARELKVYDAVSGRPLLRLGLQLPPMPRTMGSAAGHAWAIRGGGQRSGPDRFAGADDVFVYRLSDGRPFRHVVGEPIEAIISHPASPILVVVTARRLIRLHCFAHSLTLIDAPAWRPGDALAQLVVGDDISLLGLAEDATEPWRLAIGGAGAPLQPTAAEPSEPAAMVTAADRFRQMRAGSGEAATAAAPSAPVRAPAPWRDPLASYGNELARGVDAEPPQVGAEHELGELAQRLALSAAARRALVALYALHLIGAPGLAIARLARALGDWTEPLGQGELAALAMISRVRGRVALRAPVCDLLDGAAPRSIRLLGGAPTAPRAGLFRVARDGRSDAAIEAELAAQLGRIAVVEGALPAGLLEARLHGATAVTLAPPVARPRPWPQGAGLVLVLHGSPSAWIADVPAL